MALPSEDAGGAARSLLRPRGSAATRFGGSPLRTLALRFRTERSAVPATVTPAPPRRQGLTVGELGCEGTCTLMLTGELDGSSVPTLECALARCAAQGINSITLDLSGLRFIDSAGLWMITSAKSWCDRGGRGFSLVQGPEAVHHVFEMTGLSDVLPFRSPAAVTRTT